MNSNNSGIAGTYSVLFEKRQTYPALATMAWQLMTREKATILRIFLLAYIPSSLFANSLGRFDGLLSTDWLLNIIVFLISIAITMVGYVALIYLTHSTVHDTPVDWRQSVSESYPRFGQSLINTLVSWVFSLLWSILLIIPGIWAAFRYFFVLPITVIKGMKAREALDYSSHMVKGRWFQLFFLTLAYLTVYLGVNFGLEYLLIQVVPFLGTFVNAVIACLVAGFVEIYFILLTTLLFINLDFTGHETLILEPFYQDEVDEGPGRNL